MERNRGNFAGFMRHVGVSGFLIVLLGTGWFAGVANAAGSQTEGQSAPPPSAGTPTASRPDILKLMDLMGVRAAVKEAFENFVKEIGNDFEEGLQGNVPSEEKRREIVATIVRRVGESVDVPAMVSTTTVPVYEKHFSKEEIQELIEFYESPLGKHLAQVQLQIMPDAMDAGAQWAQDNFNPIFQKIMNEVTALYPEMTGDAGSDAPPMQNPHEAQ